MAVKSFGATFAPTMALSQFEGKFTEPTLVSSESVALSPAAHVLHYASSCFEGLKAHRGVDGQIRLFRLDKHIKRLQNSADRLLLPVPTTELLEQMITMTVREHHNVVPDPPGSLYIRPTLIGTEANVGAAGRPSETALLYVLVSPVGEYFPSDHTLKLAVEKSLPRTTPQFGVVKAGANYAMGVGLIQKAVRELGVDQVLFTAEGTIHEAGAANFLFIADDTVITPALDQSFLHGVTRESLLTLAAELGFKVEERALTIEEVVDRAANAEAALSGTAAVLAPIGSLIVDGNEVQIGTGQLGTKTAMLRDALLAIQRAEAADPYGWNRIVV